VVAILHNQPILRRTVFISAKNLLRICHSSSGCIHAYFSIKFLSRSIFLNIKVVVHL
jgi:hypothetical protein